MFVPVSKTALRGYLVDRNAIQHELTLAPGQMRPELEQTLKADARERLPGYFADLVAAQIRLAAGEPGLQHAGSAAGAPVT